MIKAEPFLHEPDGFEQAFATGGGDTEVHAMGSASFYRRRYSSSFMPLQALQVGKLWATFDGQLSVEEVEACSEAKLPNLGIASLSGDDHGYHLLRPQQRPRLWPTPAELSADAWK